jgi:hypothetical protein
MAFLFSPESSSDLNYMAANHWLKNCYEIQMLIFEHKSIVCLFVYFDSAHITCTQNNAWISIKESTMTGHHETKLGKIKKFHISHVYKNNALIYLKTRQQFTI